MAASERCSSCGGDHRLADGVDEHGVPLRAEPGSAGADVLGEPLVVLQVLGDGDPAGEFLRDLAVDPLEQAPAFGQVLLAGAMTVRMNWVQSKRRPSTWYSSSHIKTLSRMILTDLAASVIGPGVSPRRVRPVVVVEVDSAAIVLAPAVELPQIEVAGAQSGCKQRPGSPRCPARGRA